MDSFSVAIYYIECSVGATVGAEEEQTGFSVPPHHPVAPTFTKYQAINHDPEEGVPFLPTATVSSGGGSADIAERLGRLVDLKDLITEQEYTQKRKEILDEI